jgi:hypothetical protein
MVNDGEEEIVRLSMCVNRQKQKKKLADMGQKTKAF